MPANLERRYGNGHRHFVTFSCYARLPYLGEPASRDCFEQSLEKTRRNYRFRVDSYVVMPEHVHLLVTEPEITNLSVALQALKISVARLLRPRPFWQRRFYDFNVFTPEKQMEKRRYMHRNPVQRGLAGHMRLWRWSSYRHSETGEPGAVEIDSTWT